MCGRFVGFRNMEQLQHYFPIDQADIELRPNYNVAPSHSIPAIVRQDDKNVLALFHWGLIPFWAKSRSIGYKMINARSETAATKPSFRTAFKDRRCLIVADGFYEWKKIDGKKQPMFITLPDEKPFAFAGLWETWQPKDSDQPAIRSCTILTTNASESIADLHERMPVIPSPDAYDDWLDPDNHDKESLQSLLKEKAISEFTYRPVSPRVNSVKNNSESNIKPEDPYTA